MENKDYVSKEGINILTHKDNFDLATFEMTFIKWLRGFKKDVLDVDFKEDKGVSETEVTDNKISFRTTIKWGLEIERIDGHPSPVDPDREDDTEEPEEDDSEDLKMEKSHNKKNGVEITETFPWPEFDSGVPQEDEEDNKGNK